MARYTDTDLVKSHEFAADLLTQAKPFLAANPGITPDLITTQLVYAIGAWIADAHQEHNIPNPELTLEHLQGVMRRGMEDAITIQEQQARVA